MSDFLLILKVAFWIVLKGSVGGLLLVGCPLLGEGNVHKRWQGREEGEGKEGDWDKKARDWTSMYKDAKRVFYQNQLYLYVFYSYVKLERFFMLTINDCHIDYLLIFSDAIFTFIYL